MTAYATLLTALGWSLLNSIWQMGLVWAAYFLLTAENKRISAAGKHNLALVFVTIASGWATVSFFQLLETPVHASASGVLPLSQALNRWVPYLSDVYLLILVTRFIRYGIHFFERNDDTFGKSISPELQLTVDRYTRLLGITSRVRVHLSALAETAETSGFLRPLILMPVSLITRLSPAQLEAILIHELFHIRRNDYLINIFMSAFQGIFFFNPFARLLCKEIYRERENACDDEVLEKGYAPELYAEALFCLEKFRQVQPPGLSLAADGHQPWLLMARIRRVLGQPAPEEKRMSTTLILSMVISFALFGLRQDPALSPAPAPALTAKINPAPAKYEMTAFTMRTPEHQTTAPFPVHHKNVVGKDIVLPLPEPPDAAEQNDEDENSSEKIIFADNSEVRNFSNQQDEASATDDIQPAPGTPYVPPVSLTYDEAQPVVTQADSIRDQAVQFRIRDLIRESRMETKMNLERLQSDLSKNRKQLKKLEIKNNQLILQHQRNIKPLLETIQQQLQLKEQKAEQMKLQLLISDEEIIHI